MNNKCVLCGRDCPTEIHPRRDVTYYRCPSCGDFSATREAEIDYLTEMGQDARQQLAACARERNLQGLPELCLCSDSRIYDPSAGTFTVPYVLERVFPSRVQDRFDRALANLSRVTRVPGEAIRVVPENDSAILFAERPETAVFVLEELEKLDYVRASLVTRIAAQDPAPQFDVVVSALGYARMQQLETIQGRASSRQVFVAMWFSEDLYSVYNDGIVPAIRDCGCNPLRIDAKETNQKICDEIIAEIRRSRCLVADFTGSRGGVYFEAGFAMGLGIPVIWTCEDCKKEIDALHFDTRQYSHVLWNGADDMRRKLRNRIAATVPGIEARWKE